ncbi:MAG: nucleotidyltransferase domain-containing protein [Stellaceae bacterium]
MVLAALDGHDAAEWLFGTCARGEPRQASDIDIAILPRGELPVGFFAELDADIEESTTL